MSSRNMFHLFIKKDERDGNGDIQRLLEQQLARTVALFKVTKKYREALSRSQKITALIYPPCQIRGDTSAPPCLALHL